MSAFSPIFSGGFSRAGTPGGGPGAEASRRRVALLIWAIVMMGLADLFCTLIYMRTVGLPEANPLARWLAAFGSTQAVVCFKLLTMGMSCGCLWLGRGSRRMEACAWTCTAILLALSIHWIGFNRDISKHTNLLSCLADPRHTPALASGHGRLHELWVRIED